MLCKSLLSMQTLILMNRMLMDIHLRAAANGNMEALRVLVFAMANSKLKTRQGVTVRSLSESTQNGETFEDPRHVAWDGLIDLVHVLMSKGHDVNAPDADGYAPLILAAKGGHSALCVLLILHGARCSLENARHETALSLSSVSCTSLEMR